MSSLAATQADGYYLPPEYYESGAYKKKSKNDWYEQQQPNKKKSRSKKSSDGADSQTPVVRFELPYDGLCENCQAYCGRGTRYNAQKKQVDSYFTTPIYEFALKCRSCASHEFVIRTDPANRSFCYASGISLLKQKKEAVTSHYKETAAAAAISAPLERLEKVKAGQRHEASELERLKLLQTVNHRIYNQDSDNNAALRAAFRKDRTHRKRQLERGAALGWRQGMALLDHRDKKDCPEEEVQVQESVFGSSVKKQQLEQLNSVRQASIFSTSSSRVKKARNTTSVLTNEGDGSSQPSRWGRDRDNPTAMCSNVKPKTRTNTGSEASGSASNHVAASHGTGEIDAKPTRKRRLIQPCTQTRSSGGTLIRSAAITTSTNTLSNLTSLLAGYDDTDSD